MPMPLSSHRNRIGIGLPRRCAYRAKLKADSAVAWFADASPKLHRTIAFFDKPVSTPLRLPRDRANASPTALGRCDAIVDVCGGTHIGRLPHTLWRPWLIGSSLDAHKDSS